MICQWCNLYVFFVFLKKSYAQFSENCICCYKFFWKYYTINISKFKKLNISIFAQFLPKTWFHWVCVIWGYRKGSNFTKRLRTTDLICISNFPKFISSFSKRKKMSKGFRMSQRLKFHFSYWMPFSKLVSYTAIVRMYFEILW